MTEGARDDEEVLVHAPEGRGRRLDVEGSRDDDLGRHDGGGGEGDLESQCRKGGTEEAVASEGFQQRDAHHRGRHHDGEVDQGLDERMPRPGGPPSPGQGLPPRP